jgi:hypothetical protein
VDAEHLILAIEEDEIEGEAHPAGVDAGAAGDQQAGARPLAIEAAEAQQPGLEADRDGDEQAADAPPRQALQAGGEIASIHGLSRLSPPRSLPREVQTAVQPPARTGTGLR